MRINKLGLRLFIINSIIVIFFCYVDANNAIETNSSGFALMPLLMIDCPTSFIAIGLSSFINMKLIPTPLTNVNSTIDLYTIIHTIILAVSFLIFGGLQWYVIGWSMSKSKQKAVK